MNFTVTNKNLQVGAVQIIGVASSSLFLIGDANTISLSSAFDTPPESLIIGPFQPLEAESTNAE
ncbi:spore gernimation protein GerPD [Metabacillus fastidiosus]|uniref:spore gernimation protein GerPD n=1 Tax=Metabacillus fastidiosus TaxID=1458 RepID=UPI002E24A5B8|nr:spore gernimation protein GerPD [Metabacillus fastidiosus]